MDESSERRRSALAMLSSVGAALAGVAAGVYLADALSPAAPGILAAGLAAHLFGMVGLRRLVTSERAPAAWEQAGYWICWALVAAALLYAAVALAWRAGS